MELAKEETKATTVGPQDYSRWTEFCLLNAAALDASAEALALQARAALCDPNIGKREESARFYREQEKTIRETAASYRRMAKSGDREN